VPADYAGGGGGGADAAGGRSSSDYRRATVSRRSGIVKRSTARPQTVGERLATRAQKFIHMRKAEKGKLQPSAFAKRKSGGGATAAVTARPPSAPGARSESSPWQAVSDPSSGGTYYYNSVTGETSCVQCCGESPGTRCDDGAECAPTPSLSSLTRAGGTCPRAFEKKNARARRCRPSTRLPAQSPNNLLASF
jgi:hypothetical protein